MRKKIPWEVGMKFRALEAENHWAHSDTVPQGQQSQQAQMWLWKQGGSATESISPEGGLQPSTGPLPLPSQPSQGFLGPLMTRSANPSLHLQETNLNNLADMLTCEDWARHIVGFKALLGTWKSLVGLPMERKGGRGLGWAHSWGQMVTWEWLCRAWK